MLGIFHAFESEADDTGEPDKVQGHHWNEVHRIGSGSLFPLGAVQIDLSADGVAGSDTYGRAGWPEEVGDGIFIELNMDNLPVPDETDLRVFPMAWLDAPGAWPRLEEVEGGWVLRLVGKEGELLARPPGDVTVRIIFYCNPVVWE